MGIVLEARDRRLVGEGEANLYLQDSQGPLAGLL